jgi:hypothetical protein
MFIKHEHLPSISASEIAVWKQCKQKWYWQYFLRLQPAVTHTKLAQGTMAHAGIEAALWRRNVIDAVDKSSIEQQRSLSLSLGDQPIEDTAEEVETVAACVMKWADESLELSGLRPIGTEIKWELPLRDGRRKMTGVTWNGRMDAVLTNGWGLEAKFVGRFRSEESIDLSSQLAMYLLYLDNRDVQPGLLYLQILNKMPSTPSVNKTGGISRSQISTDWPTYRNAVLDNGYDPEDYVDMREKLAGKTFWREQIITRPTERLTEDRAALYDVSVDLMAKHKRIYMCDSPFLCSSCQFKELCLESVRGRDPQNLVESGAFVSRDKPSEEAEPEAAE